MIILEDPYVSPELATFAADRQEPVLDTPAARQAGLDYGLHLNLVSSRDFGRLCCQGQRLYSNSENALDWLYSRSGNAGLVRATELLKNKLLFRQRLAPLFPDSTELIIVPDGTAVVEDDLELTASFLRRYGTRLYVLGDAVIPAESADLLAQIEFLHVTGEVELPDALEAAFFAIPELECGKVVHEDALPKQTRAKAKDEEPDPDTVTLSGIQLTL